VSAAATEFVEQIAVCLEMARVRRIQQTIAGASARRLFKTAAVSARLDMVDAAHQHVLAANQRGIAEWRAKRRKTAPTSKNSR
jgi:hypothetical protein